MPTRLSKNRKSRGHVSAGHGRVGKHRKHPGGRGAAGSLSHHRINTMKYHPGYIGKLGMRTFRLQRARTACATVNCGQLWGMLGAEAQARYGSGSERPVIDVTRLGYLKVLGAGLPLKHALTVRAREFSKRARTKIEAAGGTCEETVAPIPAKSE